MNNYKFSLESVLEIRSNDEKDVLEEFVLAQNCVVEEEDRKTKFQNKLNFCLEKNVCSINVQDLIMQNFYKIDLEEKIEAQDVVIEVKRQELEKVRLRLQEAQKDKKIMEKLREKDKGEYETEILKKNQKEIDEFAVLRFKAGVN